MSENEWSNNYPAGSARDITRQSYLEGFQYLFCRASQWKSCGSLGGRPIQFPLKWWKRLAWSATYP